MREQDRIQATKELNCPKPRSRSSMTTLSTPVLSNQLTSQSNWRQPGESRATSASRRRCARAARTCRNPSAPGEAPCAQPEIQGIVVGGGLPLTRPREVRVLLGQLGRVVLADARQGGDDRHHIGGIEAGGDGATGATDRSSSQQAARGRTSPRFLERGLRRCRSSVAAYRDWRRCRTIAP